MQGNRAKGQTEAGQQREIERGKERGVNDNNIEQVTSNRLQRAACIKHKDNAGHAARKETERCIIKIAFECKCEGGDRRSRRLRRSRRRRRGRRS